MHHRIVVNSGAAAATASAEIITVNEWLRNNNRNIYWYQTSNMNLVLWNRQAVEQSKFISLIVGALTISRK